MMRYTFELMRSSLPHFAKFACQNWGLLLSMLSPRRRKWKVLATRRKRAVTEAVLNAQLILRYCKMAVEAQIAATQNARIGRAIVNDQPTQF